MPKAKALTKTDVVKLKGQIGALPKKETFTAEEVIFELFDDIQDAIENKGYTAGEIVKTLADNGVSIRESSFKAYMREAAKRKRSSEQKT